VIQTERYRRRNFGHLDIDVTFQDPTEYARPWTVAVSAQLAADTELLEYVCNENNKSLEHWVGKASDEKKAEVRVAPDILARYVGTCVEQKPFWGEGAVPPILEITFSEGALFGEHKGWGPGKMPLVAQSETLFLYFSSLGFEFVTDGQGAPTHLFEKHVSGDYRFHLEIRLNSLGRSRTVAVFMVRQKSHLLVNGRGAKRLCCHLS